MEIQLISQVVINAVMLGALYALIAIGLSLIFSVMRIIQFAHGQIYMLGAFLVYYMFGKAGQNFYVTLLAAAVAMALFALLLERGFFRRMRGQALPSMIVGLGLLLLLEGAALLAFGEREKYVSSPLPGIMNLGGAVIPQLRLLILGVAALLVVLLFLFLQRVKMGHAMRSVAQDEDAALLQGVNVNRTNAMGFAIGSALAAVAGGLVLPLTLVTPFIGGSMIIKAFIIIILGGMGSIPGAVVGAFILGFVESFGFTFWGAGAGLIGFVLVILLLIFRPVGIMGRE